jgi:hypothetical protein
MVTKRKLARARAEAQKAAQPRQTDDRFMRHHSRDMTAMLRGVDPDRFEALARDGGYR